MMSDARPFFILALVALGLSALARRHRVVLPAFPATTSGIALVDGDLHVVSWDAWMASAPKAIELSRKEVGDDPERIAENVFRRLFPDQVWPPDEESPLNEKWDAIVRAIGKAIGKPVRPKLEVMA